MDNIRVLLAEDHVVVRESIRQFLDRERDLEVVGEAGDGEEAVQLTAQLKPDVIVMDVAMPNVNGVEATKRIKEFCPATAVLALTAYDYDQYIERLRCSREQQKACATRILLRSFFSACAPLRLI
jgi:DNA-binding NarL/FixJ family response regulator